jgi:Kef-type K+ transport system membrane component KefB
VQSQDAATLLLQLGVLLAVAFLFGRLAERIGLPATAGALAAGLVLGPSVLGRVVPDPDEWLFTTASPMESLRGITLFCGVLLIGVAGASIDVAFVRARARAVLLISLGALGLPLVLTVASAPLAGSQLAGPNSSPWLFAAFAGLALSVSAVPVIVRIFTDLGILHRNLSQVSLSVAVIDDASVWVGLSVIAAVVHLRYSHVASAWSGDLLIALTAAIALVLIAIIAHRTLGAVDPQTVDRDTGVGGCCLVAAAFITLGAVFTAAIGLDSTLGAFASGTVVASGRLIPVETLRPLRTVVLGVLAPLFLAASALSADLTALRNPMLALTAVASVTLAIVSKSLGAYWGGRMAGLGHTASMAVSSALNARGTVQLVVASAGLRLGVINEEAFTILVLVALVTSAMAGPLIRRYIRRVPLTEEEERRHRLID